MAQAHAALAALPQSEVGAACMRWLKQVEAGLGQQGAGLMTSCSEAKVFAAVETAVAQGLAAWAPEHHGGAGMLDCHSCKALYIAQYPPKHSLAGHRQAKQCMK